MELLFRRPGGGRVKLTQDALRVIRAHVQHARGAKEAGGVLIGRHIVDTLDVIVDRVTPPLPGDRRTRMSFRRERARHQKELDDVWRSSASTSVYLGEWHTHPELVPVPSPIDLADWKRRLHRDVVQADFLLFLIAGQYRIKTWEGSRTSLQIKELAVVSIDCASLEVTCDGKD